MDDGASIKCSSALSAKKDGSNPGEQEILATSILLSIIVVATLFSEINYVVCGVDA